MLQELEIVLLKVTEKDQLFKVKYNRTNMNDNKPNR